MTLTKGTTLQIGSGAARIVSTDSSLLGRALLCPGWTSRPPWRLSALRLERRFGCWGLIARSRSANLPCRSLPTGYRVLGCAMCHQLPLPVAGGSSANLASERSPSPSEVCHSVLLSGIQSFATLASEPSPLPVCGFPSALNEGKTQQTLQEGEKNHRPWKTPSQRDSPHRDTQDLANQGTFPPQLHSVYSSAGCPSSSAARGDRPGPGDFRTRAAGCPSPSHRPTRVSVGSLNGSIVHPREVFKATILGNAAALILFHNHPSGDLTPSVEDRAITNRLMEAGKLLGISVLDHLPQVESLGAPGLRGQKIKPFLGFRSKSN